MRDRLNISLHGNGAAPEIDLSTTYIDMGNIEVNSSGNASFDIMNDGNAQLNVTSISTNNSLFTVNPASVNIGPYESRTVNIIFTPSLAGEEQADITIISNDSDEGTLTLNVRAMGSESSEWLPGSIDIGDVAVGNSRTGTFTINNTWNSDLTINNIWSNNEYFTVDLTSATIPQGESRTVKITFTPQDRGDQNSTITIDSTAPGMGSVGINVSGRGLSPEIDVNPTSLNFEATAEGGNTNLAFTIRNEGNAPLNVNSISSNSGEFKRDTSSGRLDPQNEKTVTVTFSPSAPGEPGGMITIQSDDLDEGTVTVTVSGSVALPDIYVPPVSPDIGDVYVGETNGMSFTIRNDGGAPLIISSITTDNADFSLDYSSITLQPGESSDLYVSFSPSTMGEQTCTITIVSNEKEEPTVTMSARGNGLAPEIELSQTAITIDNVSEGNNGSNTFLISNTGNTQLNVSDISIDNYVFSVSPLSVSVPAGENRTITLTFSPVDKSMQGATLTIYSNDTDEPSIYVSVTGTVSGSGLAISPLDIQFGDVYIGSSNTEIITITNTGENSLLVTDISSDNGNFSVSQSSMTVPGGENKTVTIIFSPLQPGEQYGNVAITTNEGEFNVSVYGNAQDSGRTLQITSPKDGEVLAVGRQYDIQWTGSGLTDD